MRKIKLINTDKKSSFKKLKNYSRHTGGIETYLADILGAAFIEYRAMWDKVTSREAQTNFPYFPIFETQFLCNFKCKMCHQSDENLHNLLYYPEVLTMRLFRRVIDECAEYKCPSIGLNNNNEPLLDHFIIDRLVYAAKRGIIDIIMNTNGLLLSEDTSKALIDNGLTRLLISLDAATEKTFSKIRSRHYRTVVQNIETFLETREKKGSRLPALRLSFCVINLNESEQQDFLNLWKEKADEITFQRYTPPVNNNRYLSLYPESRREMMFTCSQPFERAIIKGNGDVYPCCYQSMNTPVGNVNKESLYNIWNGDSFNNIRRIVLEEDWEAIPSCKICSETR